MSAAIPVPGQGGRPAVSAGLPVPVSVTEDLMTRFTAPLWVPGTPADSLVITYARACALEEHDPREFVLRPSATWLLPPDRTFGFGRAPDQVNTPVDVGHTLVEEGGRLDSTMPRLAGRLEFQQGLWRLTNHATKHVMVTVSGPGLSQQVSNRSQGMAVRHRRVTLTVNARERGDEGGGLVQHRFTLLSPRTPDDLPAPQPGAASGGPTTEVLLVPRWTRDQQRLLAAWAYPELIGLPPWGLKRGLTTRRILRQSLTGDDPNERVLATLRRNAGKAVGMSMTGEAGTPLLLNYLVARRGFLGVALAQLHAEYDAQHPPG
jgi:hypothetical protein